MIFEGSFFGGVQNIWGNPYLNSITILFDNYHTNTEITPPKLFDLCDV